METKSKSVGDGAAADVAEVPELVEMILLQLPLPDILLAQRVNRAWRTIITESPKLQRALFFRPATDKGLVFTGTTYRLQECTGSKDCDPNAEGRPDDQNMIGSAPDDIKAKHITARRGWIFNKGDGKETVQPVLNPFIARAYPNLCVDIMQPHHSDFETAPSFALMARPEASWKKMLFAQPPLTAAVADHGKAHHWHRLTVGNTDLGATLEDVHNSAMSFGGDVNSISGVDMLRMVDGRMWQCIEITGEEMLLMMEGFGV